MTTIVQAPLLRIPPFPGARVRTFAAAPSRKTSRIGDAAIDKLIAMLAREQVGGTYWGTRPALPEVSYTLIAVRDRSAREDAVDKLGPSPAVFCRPNEGECDPWHLVGGATLCVVDADDELALIAAIAGCRVHCIGQGRFSALDSRYGGRPELREAVRKHVTDIAYADPFSGGSIEADRAVALSASWRALVDSNRDLKGVFGVARWKRVAVAPLLWPGDGGKVFGRSVRSLGKGDRVAVWRSRLPARTFRDLQERGVAFVEMEDGFIRSSGLGADCIPPQSVVLDRLGIYFDARSASDLEELLQNGSFPADLLERARQLRQLVVTEGISKYEAGRAPVLEKINRGTCILVPGQVEDDRAVLEGGQGLTSNLELLRRVRAQAPNAHIVYKPHPDVEAGHRKGAISDDECLSVADEVARGAPISQLIDAADEVHVNTSLAGFETLLRQKPVTTYGVAFYAGWGLTRDLGAVPPRRSTRRSLDELVAATLILYPRYVDPLSGLPCPAETLARRLAEGYVDPGTSLLVRLRQLHGRFKRKLAWLGL